MAGLFDFGDSPPDNSGPGLFGNLFAPQNLPGLALAAGWLGAHKGDNPAAPLMQFAQQQMAMQNAERQNRANELQQLVGTYKILQDQDRQAYEESQVTGTPYQRNPALSQMEARLTNLVGAQPLAGARPGMFNPQAPTTPQAGGGFTSGMSPAPGRPGPGESPSLTQQRPDGSLQVNPGAPARPVGQNFMGANPDYIPLPMQTGRAPQFEQLPMTRQAQQAPATFAQLLQYANIPQATAIGMIRAGQGAELYKQINAALAPKNGPAGVTRINPITGQLEIMGGNAQPGQVPFTRDASGNLVASPIGGAAEEVARAEALKAGAVKRAEAPYSFQFPALGPGGAPEAVSTAELVRREAARQQPTPTQPQIPQAVLDAAQRGTPFIATQAPGGPVQFQGSEQPQGGGGMVGTSPAEIERQKANVGAAADLQKPIEKTWETLQNAPTDINNIQQAKQLALSRPTQFFEGSFADRKLAVSKAFHAAGVPIDVQGISDAETLQSRLFQQVLGNLKKMDAQPSQQQQFIMQRALGELTTDPSALPRVLDVMEQIIRGRVQNHNAFIDNAQANGAPPSSGAFRVKLPDYQPLPQNIAGASTTGGTIPANAVQLPNGRIATFPSPAAAQAFKRQAGMQ